MPKIKVNTNRLRAQESEMQAILSRVDSIMNQFNSVSRNLDWDIRAESNINSRLSGISRELSAESRGISGMKRYLGQAITKYNEVEDKNSGKRLENETTGSGANANVNSSSNKTKKTDSFWNTNAGKILKDTLKKNPVLGVVISTGDIISSFKDLFSDFSIPKGIKTVAKVTKNASSIKKNVKKVVTAAKDYNTAVTEAKSVISAAERTIGSARVESAANVADDAIGQAQKSISRAKSTLIKKVAGVEDSINPAAQSANTFIKSGLVSQSWGMRFCDQFSASIKESAKGLTKPAGLVTSALTVVTKAVDNIDEYKSGSISGGRAVAETVTESIIEIGKGMVVGAAVTAGLVACFGSAPVLAVGAISSGVIIGVDAISKSFTKNDGEKDFT